MAVAVSPNETQKNLSTLFAAAGKRELCYKCGERAYTVEKIGPINDVIFHRSCFKCAQCGQRLTLRTYFTNQGDFGDKEIYCANHCPRTTTRGLDASAVGIRAAINAPKSKQANYKGMAPQIGSDAMYIQHPMSAQSKLKYKNQTYSRNHYWPGYLKNNKARRILYEAQEELERRHREEEERLMKVFLAERGEENKKMEMEMNAEWETRLKELTDRYEREHGQRGRRGKDDDQYPITEHLEKEKEELRKTMTIKFQKKKEEMTLQLQKKVQEETSSLVRKQSQQMLDLLKSKEDEVKEELVEDMKHGNSTQDGIGNEELEEAMAALTFPRDLPPPHPPNCRKRDLYYDPEVFNDLDEEVMSVAEKEQKSFTDLVLQLTQNCINDLQKARAIFRWITVKDLNVLEFDETTETDTPMGLLRGIKYGTETYHTLFMRLCSYAGLACVEIKGHSKSVGYEPGMKIREDCFQNTWNAVLIGGDWWPVQCNWGARHLVLNKDQDKQQNKKQQQDKIRYQYDEHYFLTDPDEFIQEFWAQEPQWQLLERAISLDEFESMPFVRSVFFHHGLEFEKPMKAVLYTDNRGGAEVRLRIPKEFEADLVFHYQIRFADRERRVDTDYQGAKLERFVFHSLVEGTALFSVHVPIPAVYFLEVFANRIDESNKLGDDPSATMLPFRLKCTCKFKVVCDQLVGKMHPLPSSAAGEWGPSKAIRHFSMQPITHKNGVITVDGEEEIRFKVPRPLQFLCKLKMNGVNETLLERFVSYGVAGDTLKIRIVPPQTGQFGLDIYARPAGEANHSMAHACKYLLNVNHVERVENLTSPVAIASVSAQAVSAQAASSSPKTTYKGIELSPLNTAVPGSPSSSKSLSSNGEEDSTTPASTASSVPNIPTNILLGPTSHFEELGLKILSVHRDPIIEVGDDAKAIQIEIGHTEPTKFNCQFKRIESYEDCSNLVAIKEGDKKVKISINVTQSGNYTLAVNAKRKRETGSDYVNVYNYVARYDQDARKKKKVPTATLR